MTRLSDWAEHAARAARAWGTGRHEAMAWASLALALALGAAQGGFVSWERVRSIPSAEMRAVDQHAFHVRCWIPGSDAPWPWDGERYGRSTLRVFEDGRPLGPPHTGHDQIARLGAGRYSHWNSTLSGGVVFSSSDGSDPRANGRSYELRYDWVPPAGCGRLVALPDLPLNARRRPSHRQDWCLERSLEAGSQATPP